MVKRQRHLIKFGDIEKSNGLTMQTRPNIFCENYTHRPTRRDLIFDRPAIFCFLPTHNARVWQAPTARGLPFGFPHTCIFINAKFIYNNENI